MPTPKTAEPLILRHMPCTTAYLLHHTNLSYSAIERNLRQMRAQGKLRIAGWETARIPIYGVRDNLPDVPRPPYDIRAQWARSNAKRKSKNGRTRSTSARTASVSIP